MSMKIIAATKRSLISVIIRLSQNTMIVKKKIVIGKMKDETEGVTTEEFVELKLKRYY